MESARRPITQPQNFFTLSVPDASEYDKNKEKAINLILVGVTLIRLFVIFSMSGCTLTSLCPRSVLWYAIPNSCTIILCILLLTIKKTTLRLKKILSLLIFFLEYHTDFEILINLVQTFTIYTLLIGYSSIFITINVYIIERMYAILPILATQLVYFSLRMVYSQNNSFSKMEWVTTLFISYICMAITTYCMIMERRVKNDIQSEADKTYFNWKESMDSCPVGFLLMQDNEVLYSNQDLNKLFQILRTSEDQNYVNILESINSIAKPMEAIPKNSTGIEFKLINIESKIIEWRKKKLHFKCQPTYVHIFIDVTASSSIEKATTQKKYIDMLVATSTHELRTPLNGIKSFILFALANCNEEGKLLLGRAISACELQESLINDIMDFAKLQVSNMVINEEEISVHKLVHDCYSIFEFQAKEKGLSLSTKIGKLVPEVFRSDQRRVKQILLNLLSNALKFTSKGGIKLKVNKKNNAINFTVSDSGIGIKPEDIEKLFKPFVMIESASKVNKSGTGLGLNLCKNLCQHLGGDIRVKSTYGSGTKFTFYLPQTSSNAIDYISHNKNDKSVAEENDKEIANKPDMQSTAICRLSSKTYLSFNSKIRNKIFLVDDVPLNITVAAKLFKTLKYDCFKAFSGLEAIETIKKHNYEIKIAFIDLNMPNMDGYELCTILVRMMKDKEISKFIMIALTAENKCDVEQLCIAKGFNGVVCKPLSLESIKEILKKASSVTN
jgi:CheY-like chemotaxis protein/nitrogen-specific signal transduction histidine kinase